jgi:hypothetical protein
MTTTKTKPTTEKPIETLPTNPFVFEILELASKQRSNAKKVEVLKTYEHDSLKAVLIWNFDPTVVSLLPPGEGSLWRCKGSKCLLWNSLK